MSVAANEVESIWMKVGGVGTGAAAGVGCGLGFALGGADPAGLTVRDTVRTGVGTIGVTSKMCSGFTSRGVGGGKMPSSISSRMTITVATIASASDDSRLLSEARWR